MGTPSISHPRSPYPKAHKVCTFIFAISTSPNVQQLNSVYVLSKVVNFVEEQEDTEYIGMNGSLQHRLQRNSSIREWMEKHKTGGKHMSCSKDDNNKYFEPTVSVARRRHMAHSRFAWYLESLACTGTLQPPTGLYVDLFGKSSTRCKSSNDATLSPPT